MPDQLNKQTLINLLIDSPLREPIKINLIDIINNTSEPDLPKIFPTIVKELEIFQKATERRMKLAEETIAKLGPVTESSPASSDIPVPPPPAPPVATPDGLSAPVLDLPPLPTSQTPEPPLPVTPTPAPEPPQLPPATPLPVPEPLGGTAPTSQGDEAALAEIQKELDSLKTASADEIAKASAQAPAPQT